MKSLYFKLILGYLAFGAISFILISTFSADLTDRYLLDAQAGALSDAANSLASDYSAIYSTGSNRAVSLPTGQRTVSAYQDLQVWVADRKGTIISDSNRDIRKSMEIPGFDPAADSVKAYTVGSYYGMFPEDVLTVSAPITGNYTTYGYVIIHLPMREIRSQRDNILDILYLSLVVVFGLSLIILLVFTTQVYFPLKKITAAANEYAAGNLDYKIKSNSRDEIGYLAGTLNYMSEELSKLDDYQKQFISNVSHDFRSPLTSIKGYLEAILDGTIPPELYDKYINLVISETERLNKLTQSMLTLNSLDSKGYLRRAAFDLNRVIKATAAAFEGTCNAKDIMLDLTFADDTEMVYADMEKIQQVLYNLIDNAIKFSHPRSVIYISTEPKYEKVFVSVKDTGIGIPKGSLKKIWDRFYKTDVSRGRDKKGTGLGLSIVRDIIQSHGEHIDVISTEGVGTEFIFSLPRSGG
ncbi:MAG: HAMP domain-containing histidine kinase [Lachnospiraceae bacterium]|jgi:signal transduction histidine kinase|nr:HAMP domain-containing histidine kinase [Lachnospiraceae bacterium]